MANNKARVLSSSIDNGGLNPKMSIPATCAKLKEKCMFSCSTNIISTILYSLLTLCREGNGWVSKAEFSSSLKDAEKKYKILNHNK